MFFQPINQCPQWKYFRFNQVEVSRPLTSISVIVLQIFAFASEQRTLFLMNESNSNIEIHLEIVWSNNLWIIEILEYSCYGLIWVLQASIKLNTMIFVFFFLFGFSYFNSFQQLTEIPLETIIRFKMVWWFIQYSIWVSAPTHAYETKFFFLKKRKQHLFITSYKPMLNVYNCYICERVCHCKCARAIAYDRERDKEKKMRKKDKIQQTIEMKIKRFYNIHRST